MGEKADRRETFSRLMGEYGVALRRLTAAYLRDPAARDDLLQEIALAIWTGIPSFRGEASERTWLYRIAHNTASTQLHKLIRRRKRERQSTNDDPEPTSPDTPESNAHQADRQARFFEALRRLPTLDFQIVTMHFDGLSYSEIAEVVGLTQTNVGARLTRIRKALAEQLGATETQP